MGGSSGAAHTVQYLQSDSAVEMLMLLTRHECSVYTAVGKPNNEDNLLKGESLHLYTLYVGQIASASSVLPVQKGLNGS